MSGQMISSHSRSIAPSAEAKYPLQSSGLEHCIRFALLAGSSRTYAISKPLRMRRKRLDFEFIGLSPLREQRCVEELVMLASNFRPGDLADLRQPRARELRAQGGR